MIALPEAASDNDSAAPTIALSAMNLCAYPMVNGMSRIKARFYGEAEPLARIEAAVGRMLNATDALDLGLVTATPDELDWADEVRVALEERASLSPDELTGMEANLRFGPVETMVKR